MDFIQEYLNGIGAITQIVDKNLIEQMVQELAYLRATHGRLFLIGLGGSAANCSHAVNDFRKLCHIETYTPLDNISEITARTNDDGWNTIFSSWLTTSKASQRDALFILSVGGGDAEKGVSTNIIEAIDEAKQRKMKVFGIVGRDGGYTKQAGDCVLVIPTVNPHLVTPHVESFQSIIWHAIVSHPSLSMQKAKWETLCIH